MNLEDPDYRNIETSNQLYEFIEDRVLRDKQMYIFFDEIQRIKDYEKVVSGLHCRKNCDVYITGSNAYMLSGELATFLAGRYISIKMLPLSFDEYVSAFPDFTVEARLDRYKEYTHNSSFPYSLEFADTKARAQYLQDIYETILLKDIVARHKYSDIEMIQSIVRFLMHNIGNMCTAKKIADTMTSAGRKISVNTVENYLSALTDCFIFYKVGCFDIKGKLYLSNGSKYYAADVGLRRVLLGVKDGDDGHILENIVFLELLRRYYQVYIGKVGNTEVDFIVLGDDGEEYYQVAYTIIDTDGATLKRELAPLDAISDNNPKYLLTMDSEPLTSHNGIKQMNVLDWLLKDYKG